MRPDEKKKGNTFTVHGLSDGERPPNSGRNTRWSGPGECGKKKSVEQHPPSDITRVPKRKKRKGDIGFLGSWRRIREVSNSSA